MHGPNKVSKAYQVGHVSGFAGDVDDPDVLVQLEREELVDQGLRVAVAHDVLAGIEVLKVLQKEKE